MDCRFIFDFLNYSVKLPGLHEIIKGHTTYSYTNFKNASILIDADPDNPGNMIRVYEGSMSEDEALTNFSREHVWAKTYGFKNTQPMYNDYHNLHPCETNLNSTRGDNYFGEVATHDSSTSIYKNSSKYSWANELMDGNYIGGGYFEPKDEFKGDVARTIFYMAIRYEGDNGEVDLEVDGDRNTSRYNTFDLSTADGKHGDFEYLYEWATSDIDPVSDYEVNRNNVIDQNYQHNRNPFIDHPEFIIMIYDKTYDGPGALEV